MTLEQQLDKSWMAYGNGPLRPIVVEAETRALARVGYCVVFSQQYDKISGQLQLPR